MGVYLQSEDKDQTRGQPNWIGSVDWIFFMMVIRSNTDPIKFAERASDTIQIWFNLISNRPEPKPPIRFNLIFKNLLDLIKISLFPCEFYDEIFKYADSWAIPFTFWFKETTHPNFWY